jgi:Flp pilus assembly protein TadD
MTEAKQLLATGPSQNLRAALALYRAVLLAPQFSEAVALLEQVCANQGLNFGSPKNPKIPELEKLLDDDPLQPGVLNNLAQLYRMDGNPHKSLTYLKRYLRLRPKDGVAQGQLAMLTGMQAVAVPASAAQSKHPKLEDASTGALLAGVQTGGFEAEAKVPSVPRSRGCGRKRHPHPFRIMENR